MKPANKKKVRKDGNGDKGVKSAPGGLQRMYETGSWSDLKIVTPTKVFAVHKAVLCPIWSYAHAACTRGFAETHSNEIKLPEEANIVELILRYFYELPFFDCSPEAKKRDQALFLIRLATAIDKYGVSGLSNEVQVALEGKVGNLGPKALTDVGIAVFAHDRDHLKVLRDIVAMQSSRQLGTILRTPQAWEHMHGSPEYLHQTLLWDHPADGYSSFYGLLQDTEPESE